MKACCTFENSLVLNSRPNQEVQGAIYRRRECKKCSARFSTVELIVPNEGSRNAQKFANDAYVEPLKVTTAMRTLIDLNRLMIQIVEDADGKEINKG